MSNATQTSFGPDEPAAVIFAEDCTLLGVIVSGIAYGEAFLSPFREKLSHFYAFSRCPAHACVEDCVHDSLGEQALKIRLLQRVDLWKADFAVMASQHVT